MFMKKNIVSLLLVGSFASSTAIGVKEKQSNLRGGRATNNDNSKVDSPSRQLKDFNDEPIPRVEQPFDYSFEDANLPEDSSSEDDRKLYYSYHWSREGELDATSGDFRDHPSEDWEVDWHSASKDDSADRKLDYEVHHSSKQGRGGYSTRYSLTEDSRSRDWKSEREGESEVDWHSASKDDSDRKLDYEVHHSSKQGRGGYSTQNSLTEDSRSRDWESEREGDGREVGWNSPSQDDPDANRKLDYETHHWSEHGPGYSAKGGSWTKESPPADGWDLDHPLGPDGELRSGPNDGHPYGWWSGSEDGPPNRWRSGSEDSP